MNREEISYFLQATILIADGGEFEQWKDLVGNNPEIWRMAENLHEYLLTRQLKEATQ